MKLKTTVLIASTVASSFGATKVTLANFNGTTSGVPIVDNAGNAIDRTLTNIQVGSFSAAFAATLNTLDMLTADSDVINAFVPTPASSAFSFSANGLFNGDITTGADPDGSLGASSTPLFALITYTPAGGNPEALVLNFGIPFPQQNAAGAADVGLGREIALSDVVFGGGATAVNLESLPNVAFRKDTFANGIGFNGGVVIPEPSTGLLAAIAGLALAARRRR